MRKQPQQLLIWTFLDIPALVPAKADTDSRSSLYLRYCSFIAHLILKSPSAPAAFICAQQRRPTITPRERLHVTHLIKATLTAWKRVGFLSIIG